MFSVSKYEDTALDISSAGKIIDSTTSKCRGSQARGYESDLLQHQITEL